MKSVADDRSKRRNRENASKPPSTESDYEKRIKTLIDGALTMISDCLQVLVIVTRIDRVTHSGGTTHELLVS